MNVTILGAGAWGSALAISLAARHRVLLWGRDGATMRAIAERRENFEYLPGFALPAGMAVSADFEAALAHVGAPDGLLIAASSVAGLRPLGERLQGRSMPHLVWLCKGFEQHSDLLPHQVVRRGAGPGDCAGRAVRAVVRAGSGARPAVRADGRQQRAGAGASGWWRRRMALRCGCIRPMT